MSPFTDFPLDAHPENPITERVLDDPNITFDVSADGLVIAIKAELLVHGSARLDSTPLDLELSKIARNTGTLAEIPQASPTTRGGAATGAAPPKPFRPDADGPAGSVEIWRLNDPNADSIDEARRLRGLADDQPVRTLKGPLLLPAVSPNHVAILSSKYDGCPAGPPHPAPPERPDHPFVEPLAPGATARVVVIDSGYISTDPPHAALDGRVNVVAGEWLDTLTDPTSWRPDPPDGPDTNSDGRLDGIAGHGTFIAGLIAHACPHAEITVVGQRDEEMSIGGLDRAMQCKLYATEVSIANSVLSHCDADVIQCGFAFPTLDDYPSLPFVAVMEVLRGPEAPRRGVAVVAPAGNEESPRRYWPAALDDVIGVAATNRRGNRRAWFSNWGPWCDCCTRGEDVYSTFIDWDGPIEGEPMTQVEHFAGWARWDGTSFAAPKVSAAIACLVAGSEDRLLPIEAWERLLHQPEVTELTDDKLSGTPGVTLAHLHLG